MNFLNDFFLNINNDWESIVKNLMSDTDHKLKIY